MRMSKSIKSSHRHQRGDFLIEAMIGVLLMGIVGAGVTFITSKVSVSQQQMAMQEIAIGSMRSLLLQNGSGTDVCEQTPFIFLPNDEALRVQVSGCGANEVALVGGKEIPGIQAPIMLTVNSPTLGELSVGAQRATSSGDGDGHDYYH